MKKYNQNLEHDAKLHLQNNLSTNPKTTILFDIKNVKEEFEAYVDSLNLKRKTNTSRIIGHVKDFTTK